MNGTPNEAEPAYHLFLDADEISVTAGALRLLISDEAHESQIRALARAVLGGLQGAPGQSGVLTIGCHGPGAPAGIFEGIATTKGYKTYYMVHDPAPGVDANRTIFHVR